MVWTKVMTDLFLDLAFEGIVGLGSRQYLEDFGFCRDGRAAIRQQFTMISD